MLKDASDQSERPGLFLEKDIWNVWCIRTLFNGPFGKFLVFKGGTSLSKAHGLIQRFSEDVDIACDIRHFFPDLETNDYDHLPRSISQADKLAKKVRVLLQEWMDDEAMPLLQSRFKEVDPGGRIERDRNVIFVHYTPRTEPIEYVRHAVKLEFYPRSAGKPCQTMPIVCDIAGHIKGVEFPEAKPRVLSAERTFWEKAIAMFVLCLREDTKGKAYARHLYDIVCLDRAGVVDRAVADRKLADTVAEHDTVFRNEKYGYPKQRVDYHDTYYGNLQLVPDHEPVMQDLRQDYQRMIDSFMFFGTPPPFAHIEEECKKLAGRINAICSAAVRQEQEQRQKRLQEWEASRKGNGTVPDGGTSG